MVIDIDDKFMSISEAAKTFGFSKIQLYNLVNAGVIPCTIMKTRKVTKKTMLKFLEECNGKNFSDAKNVRDIVPEDLTSVEEEEFRGEI